VLIAQDGDGVALDINQTTAATSNVIDVINSGTGAGIFINQDGNGIALNIDNAGTADSIQVNTTDFMVSDTGEVGIGVAANAFGSLQVVNTSTTRTAAVNINQQATNIGRTGLSVTNSSSGNCVFMRNVPIAGTGTVAVIQQRGTTSAITMTIESDATGNFIGTDAGGTLNTTGAKLTNAGVWTDGTCFASTKGRIEEVFPKATILEDIENMSIVRWTTKREPTGDAVLSPLQDDLVKYFDLPSDRGIAPKEIAAVALLGIKALKKEIDELKIKLKALGD